MASPRPKPLKMALDGNPEDRERAGRQGPVGPTGPAGPAGAQGEKGEPGRDHTSEIAVLRAQVELLVKELETQLTRIGQIQAQLDHISTGQSSEPRNRRSTDRTEH